MAFIEFANHRDIALNSKNKAPSACNCPIKHHYKTLASFQWRKSTFALIFLLNIGNNSTVAQSWLSKLKSLPSTAGQLKPICKKREVISSA
ncbi:hypothetical protein TYRP_012310 [Tyrophagus putrescentiae]|nr:hypothetical protein TYRP_012310 [Tyrophagus putrescentiae]